jgi:hypothetical protein
VVGVVRCNLVQTAPIEREYDGTNMGTFFRNLGTIVGTSNERFLATRMGTPGKPV